MTFYLPGFRSFPKLWKSTPYFELGPATSPVSLFLAVTGNRHRWFSVKTTSLPNGKAMNLLVAKARTLKKGNDSNRQVSPDHYFAAGAAKKRSQVSSNPQHRDHALPRVSALQLPTKPLNSEEWDKLKEDFNGKATFEDWVISQMVRSCSSIDVAKSLLAWVAAKNNGIVGYNLLVKYLSLCVSHKQTSEVIDVYEIMKAKYKCLESGANTLLIRGLIHSDRWREALLLLEDIKKVMVPSKRNYDDCIQGALLHQDVNVAWSLYQELVGHNLIPLLETLKAFFDFGKDLNDDHYSNKLLDILLYLRNNQLYPGESFAHSIKAWFESIPGRQWKGQFTTIQKSGRCSSCGRTLESIHLSPEEYEFLKEKIMRDVIDGGDQYKKTTPQELKRFESFVNSCPPFDIVIDGLNVAKMFPKSRESQTLLGVVSQLAQQNLQLLVLGRKHMLTPSSRWRKDEMEQVQRQAHCFFADNISEDDPFLLYATLNSGSHCKFITKDLMRDHKACLPDARSQHLFFKWQQGHQLAIVKGFRRSQLTLQDPLRYDTVVQTTGDSWHIPYDEDPVQRSSCEVPTKWLCLQGKAQAPAPC
ncbi:mitochondrial ribonuclease P catalytic subunit [Peromyscus californicus insignis]|uniref:mitochondrial ribonuclease P catalytic subunit n=1 Tax=Peromyscus californicus insignis TaxID=564181 RepID=UPI0022A80365|nr:mitochondrial ribonuclease P catalytic subunit [Peromyscus californicus insignis]XP_052594497.1 mitochondrial ribonuclease P catalytic subunit [Peromyscus californicus insignis]